MDRAVQGNMSLSRARKIQSKTVLQVNMDCMDNSSHIIKDAYIKALTRQLLVSSRNKQQEQQQEQQQKQQQQQKKKQQQQPQQQHTTGRQQRQARSEAPAHAEATVEPRDLRVSSTTKDAPHHPAVGAP